VHTGVSVVRRVLRRHLFTLVVLTLTVVFAAIGRGQRGPATALRLAMGTGHEQVVDAQRWWTPITSVLLSDGGLELPLAIIGIVLVIGFAERLMGTVRTAIAFVVSTVLGVMVGVAVQQVGTLIGELWSRRVSELITLDPMTAVAGTIMTASAFAGPVWRRRIRVIVISVTLVFLFYSGEPSDLYRFLAALVGFGLGAVLRPRTGDVWWQRSSHHETRVLLSAIVAITAIGPAITIFSYLRLGALAPLGMLLTDAHPNSGAAFDQCQAMQITRECLRDITFERISGVGPVLLTVLPLLTLLVASFALARGRRFGVWLAAIVNLALAALAAYFYGFLPLFGKSFVFQFRTPHYWEVSLALAASSLVPAAIAVLVLVNRSHFSVRASARSVRLYLGSIVIALLGLSALYLGVGTLVRDRFHPQVTFVDLLADLPERFVPIGFLRIERLVFLPNDPITQTLYYWIGPCFWLVVIGGALAVALAAESRSYAVDLPRIRRLLRAGGGGSMGQLATWPGNSYWFSPDGRAAVAYRVINSVAISTSEPIGDPDAARAAISQFATFCDDHGWTPVFYSIHETFLAECERMGWASMSVGEETVVRPSEWQTTGKQWQDVRSSVNRAERAGVRAEWTTFERLSISHANQINEISEQWVAEKDLPEMGFTLGGIDELREADVRLMIAFDENDRVIGVTSWLPCYRDGVVIGWTLDFMRRSPDGMNGIMEFLIARSAERFRDDGIEFMSLSGAPLARSKSDDDAVRETAAARILGYIASRLEPVYGFQSLFQFKRKFQPEFHNLAMAYPDPLALPAIGLALARAYVPSLSLRQSARFVRSLG
jgi:phosphatidylglycerol lysyltransferase